MFSDKILKKNLTPLTFDTGLFCKYITTRCFRHVVAFIKYVLRESVTDIPYK